MKDLDKTVLIGVGIALVFALFLEGNLGLGAATLGSYEPPLPDRSASLTLHDYAIKFFEIEDIKFPDGVCLPVAHELYGDVAYNSVDVTVGYKTTGEHRMATTNFVLSDGVNRNERYGTIDFVKSSAILKKEESDSFISISSEAVARVPKATRATYLIMDMFGTTIGSNMYITRGRWSIPSMDCIFLIKEGYAFCNCDVHTIKGIAVGGITRPPEAEERYLDLVEQTRQIINESFPLEEDEVIQSGDVLVSPVEPFR